MTDGGNTDASSQLDYASLPPLHRRKVVRRGLLMLGIVSIVICGWVMLPRYWRNAQAALQHRQWARYTRPPTRIAFEPPGAKAQELFQPGSGYIMRPGGVFHFPPLTFPDGSLFLHGRRSNAGARVVWVSIGYVRTDRLRLRLEADVLIPATIGRPSWRAPTTHAALPEDAAGNLPRIYAGQTDPDDESHFTMRYEFKDGRNGMIHGWLRDDDSIDFETREDSPKEKESQ